MSVLEIRIQNTWYVLQMSELMDFVVEKANAIMYCETERVGKPGRAICCLTVMSNLFVTMEDNLF